MYTVGSTAHSELGYKYNNKIKKALTWNDKGTCKLNDNTICKPYFGVSFLPHNLRSISTASFFSPYKIYTQTPFQYIFLKFVFTFSYVYPHQYPQWPIENRILNSFFTNVFKRKLKYIWPFGIGHDLNWHSPHLAVHLPTRISASCLYASGQPLKLWFTFIHPIF